MTLRLLSRALQLAELGWYVFPLRPGDKRPLPGFTKWEERATTDRAQIMRWWLDAPDNIGVATGPSGLLVIDCDTSQSADPPEWRHVGDVVEVAGKRLPRTFTVRTPSKGLHLYFTAADQPLGNTAGKLGRGIDTRGVGGYVVGPGSVSSAGYYRIADPSPTVDLPESIIEPLRPTTSPVPGAVPMRHYRDHYLRAILDGEAERVRTAAPGSRNNALNIAAFILGQLVGGAELSESQARAILWRGVRTHLGVDGFNIDEAERTITSGLTAGALRPRLVRTHL
jgi:Bifunctional DNA primase/polymerase, N-terminal